MKAIRIHDWGTANVIALEDIGRPIPGAGEVLVRVRAAGVGNWDSLIRSGSSGLGQSLPLTLGAEVAGVVESSENNFQESFSPGQQVYGSTNALFIGGYAQYAVCSTNMLAPMSLELTFVEAASVPVIAVTAWQMVVDHARLTAGQTVIVHGAIGNVGAYAVQIACRRRAKVIATVTSSKQADEARRLGASDVIQVQDSTIARLVGLADAVIDTAGGESSQRQLLRTVKEGGAFVSCVSAPDADLAAKRNVRAVFFIVKVTREYLERLTQMFGAGDLKTRLGITLPLEDARVAHEMLDGIRPRPKGKIVLNVE